MPNKPCNGILEVALHLYNPNAILLCLIIQHITWVSHKIHLDVEYIYVQNLVMLLLPNLWNR